MQRRTVFPVLVAMLTMACTRHKGEGKVELRRDGSVVKLDIPDRYLLGAQAIKTEYSIWISFVYPEMKPVNDPENHAFGISLLFVNPGCMRTQAEQNYMRQKTAEMPASPDQLDEQDLVIVKPSPKGQKYAYQTTYIFNRTPDGRLISYEIAPDLEVSVSRRYSESLELRYILPQELLVRKRDVDAAIVRLVKQFIIKKQEHDN